MYTSTFEGIFSVDVVGGAIQAPDRADHDRRRLGPGNFRAEADGQEQNESTGKHMRNQPSPHDGRTPLPLLQKK